MSVHEGIEQMIPRACAKEGKLVSQRIELYGNGLAAKLREAEYAFHRLRELAELPDYSTTGEDEFAVPDQIHFYVDAFFAFLYSALDVLAQVINQKQHLRLNEDQVSFKNVESTLANHRPGSSLQLHFSRIRNARRFVNLDRYRNCSTHRRQIYIQTTTVSVPPGYGATGPVQSPQRLLCDDPLTLKPKVTQQRELLDYCTKTLGWAQNEISKVVRDI